MTSPTSSSATNTPSPSSSFASTSSNFSNSNSSSDPMVLSYVLNNTSTSANTPPSPVSSSYTNTHTHGTPGNCTLSPSLNPSTLPTLEPRLTHDNYATWPIQINSQTFNDPVNTANTTWDVQLPGLAPNSPRSGGSSAHSYGSLFSATSQVTGWEHSNGSPSTPRSSEQQLPRVKDHWRYSEYCSPLLPPPPPPTTPTSSAILNGAKFQDGIKLSHSFPNAIPGLSERMSYHHHHSISADAQNQTQPVSLPRPVIVQSPEGGYQQSGPYPRTQPHPYPAHFQSVQEIPSRPKSKSNSSSLIVYPSSSLISLSSTSPKHTQPHLPLQPHSNTPYTTEQVDFISYGRDTLKLGWPTLLAKFRDQFPGRKNVTVQAIQGRFYRAQKIVRMDKGGYYTKDENGWRRGSSGSIGEGSDEVEGEGSDGCSGDDGDCIGDDGWEREGTEQEKRSWQEKKVNIRDREIEGIKALGLKYELIDLEGSCTDYPSDPAALGEDVDETMGEEIEKEDMDMDIDMDINMDINMDMMSKSSREEKGDTRSGAERFLSYRWSIAKEVDRERATKKIIERRAQRNGPSKK